MPYIVESNLKVREVTVEKNNGEFSIVHFIDSDIKDLSDKRRSGSSSSVREAGHIRKNTLGLSPLTPDQIPC